MRLDIFYGDDSKLHTTMEHNVKNSVADLSMEKGSMIVL